MRINADFDERVAVHFDDTPWVASPAVGVERKMLDRIGAEVARATTIVRFAPGSAFSAHTHDGGEEYLVLDGVFQDEEGDFTKGTYVRNPPTSQHTPAAADGATILVKLHQFDPDDRNSVVRDTSDFSQASTSLFQAPAEDVQLAIWGADQDITLAPEGGLEVFVLEGSYSQQGEEFVRWDWLRLPPGQGFSARTGPEGARVWLKSGHLLEMLEK